MREESGSPQISIIVPVYNAEPYIHKCVDSILAQSFADFEVLLVDDGSPDNSPTICDEYARTDTRVKVIHKANGGVSSARNTGLDSAKGEYVVFIDSDDFVAPDYIANLINTHSCLSLDGKETLIISDYQPFSDRGDEKREFPSAFTVCCDGNGSTAQQFRDLVFSFRVFPPYCKLYRREIIEEKKLRYNTAIRSAEDFDFNMRYIDNVERICYYPLTDYHYREGYKKYIPSNHGVLGESEIKSAHIMANGISDFAKRLGVYDEVYDEICIWAAKKHYFNRLRMLFAESNEVSTEERRALYRELTSDKVYRSLYKCGIVKLSGSTTQIIGSRLDSFNSWLLFYKVLEIKNKQRD